MINFANPAFLWALPLLAVPVVLHLMQRQVPKRLVFPAIRFIKKASDANQGHKSIKDLLTLLTRLMILAALILFFAKPGIVESVTPDVTTGSGRIIFLVDCSSSMAAGDLRGFISNVAKEYTEDKSDWQFAAIASSNRVVQENPWAGAESVVEQMARLTPEPVKGEHSAAIDRVRELIGTAASTTCVVISDFQDSDWSLQQLEQLESFCTLELRTMPSRLPENCAIVAAEHALYDRKGQKVLSVTARVKNYSVSRKSLTMRLEQDGQKNETTLTMEGGEVKRLNLEVSVGQTSIAWLYLESADGYSPDNSLVLWTGPRAPAKVGVSTPSGQDALLERFFLEKALVLKQEGGRPVVFKPNVDSADFDGSGDELDVIIALDTVPSDMAALKDWIEKGGRFIYFSGPDALNILGNMNLGGLLKSRGISMHGDRARLESIYVDSVNTSDPILAPFKKAAADLNQFPIFRYVGIEADKSAESLIKLQNSKDLLIRERLGLGEVYVFGIGILPLWSEFPTSRSFVPIIRQLVEEPVNEQRNRVQSLAVGETVSKELLGNGADIRLTSEPGVVMVGEDPVVVNIDRTESIPEHLDVTAIASVSSTGETGSASFIPAGTRLVTDLTRLMAALVLLGVLLELIAANSQLFAKGR